MKKENDKGLIRVLVIEDNATLVLAGLRAFFRPERDRIKVCESFPGVEEAVKLSSPDSFELILLDLMIPDHTPGDNISRLKDHFPDKPVVIYTSIDSDLWRKRMFSLGAHGYVHKNDSREVLKRAILDAFDGKITLHTDAGNKPETVLYTTGISDNSLSIIEKEMLSMLAEGLRYKQIATSLNMNEVAIEATVKRIRKKFGAASTTQLIHMLTEQGVL